MYLVAGLGNPGAQYAQTRHNIGFMAADEIFRRYKFSTYKNKFDGLIAEGQIGGEKIYLLKPQTFMNLSGHAVAKAALFYKILPENIIAIHDDIDLSVGQMKAKCGGGTGGHNGLKSLDAMITPAYNRIRIGVGHPNGKGPEVADYVLGHFSKAESKIIEACIEAVPEAVEVLIKNGLAACSNYLGMTLEKNK